MSPISPSTKSMKAEQSPESPFRVVRKRNRIPLSCGPCRHRKLKCDRSTPCQNCVKRVEATSCVYATPTGRKRSNQAHSHDATNSSDDMQNRIDRLEGLVLSLMTNGSQSAGPNAAAGAVLSARSSTTSSGQQRFDEVDETEMLDDENEDGIGDDSDTDKVTKSFGVMKVDSENKKTIYYGEGHWAAALNDIAEVRNYLQTHQTQFAARLNQVEQTRRDMNIDPGPALLLGTSKPPPWSDILSQLPSRYLTDILVARYFNTCDPATHVIHGPVFQKQYNAHWAEPSNTSIVWIAMLFAILRIALLSYVQDRNEPPEFAGKSMELSRTFRAAVANCLILADYTKPHQYLMETLIFHLHAEYCHKRDSEASVWVLVGMILRLAMRMGYHRDSKMFPKITPFEGEMRRRVWAFLRQADILFSFQISLPGMIRIGDSDTELPRNIYDEEFDEDTPSLPPSRPMSEPTSVSYLITKARLAFGFGRVLEEVNRLCSERYEEILKIDNGLREIFDGIPGHLKLQSMDEQFRLPTKEVVARFRLAAIYHKSQCVLHRRFLRWARTNPRYAYNRRTCLQSAMALMDFQSTLHRETRESGRLNNEHSWFTSLTAHDFLLAATVISMVLYQEKRRADASAASTATSPRTNFSDSNSNTTSGASGSGSEIHNWGPPQEDLLRALEVSRDVWTQLRDESMEAYKASEVLNLLYEQLTASSGQHQDNNEEKAYESGINTRAQGQVDEKQNAAMTLGLLSSGGKSPNGSITGQPTPSQKMPGSIFDSNGSIESFLQPTAPQASTNGGTLDFQNVMASPGPFLGMLGVGETDVGGGMNLDWDAFDSYIQSSNLGLDPANTLWSSFSQSSDPFPANPSATTAPSSSVATEMSPALYPPAPKLSAYDSTLRSQPASSNNVQKYDTVSSNQSMQRPPPPVDESGKPSQAMTGMPTTQSGGVAGWK